jgi:AGCS family alanine or glycine:cation symporter
VEIFQFGVITSSVSANFGVDKLLVTMVLLALVMWAGCGGVKRVGNISTVLIPVFVALYVLMSSWVILLSLDQIPSIMQTVFSSAFSGHAVFGGFLGASVMTTISHGVKRGCYSGDLGVGYASVIHSETSLDSPSKQASLTIFDLFLDAFIICTASIMIVLVSGVWHQGVDSEMLVQVALGQYFPYMNIFMPVLLFLLGYSTINAYFVVGIKSAEFLSPKWGRKLYFVYAAAALFIFSFVELYEAQIVMSLINGLLLLINGIGIWRLRAEVSFDFAEEKSQLATN